MTDLNNDVLDAVRKHLPAEVGTTLRDELAALAAEHAKKRGRDLQETVESLRIAGALAQLDAREAQVLGGVLKGGMPCPNWVTGRKLTEDWRIV
jgi:hypothetical protein